MRTSPGQYDPFSAAVRDDPFPYYAWLRANAPVAYSETLGFWIISRYADVVDVLSNPRDFSSAKGVGPDHIPGVPMMLTSDAPAHKRLRTIVQKAFTPRMVAQMESSVRATAERLAGPAVERGAFDLVSAAAGPFPLAVIAELLGLGTDRYDTLARWSDATFDQLAGRASLAGFAHYMQCWDEFKSFMLPILAARRAAPRNDLVSVLAATSDGDTMLSTSEILNFVLLLLAAGNETTTNLIASTVAVLTEHPDQAAALRADPQLVPAAVEEVLRLESPVQALFRTTTRHVQLRGVTIPDNSKVMVLYGSANRDPDQFPDPDRFDIRRPRNRHLAFGHGVHHCLGAQLARLEARVFVETFLHRTAAFAIDPRDRMVRRSNPLLRGFERLPLIVEPSSACARPARRPIHHDAFGLRAAA